MKKKILILLTIVFVVHFGLLFSLKFTAWPEMLLWPYLMIKGWLPYTDIAIVHTPLLFTKLTIFFKIFGVGILQLKIFTWLLILILDVLVFWITKKLWGIKTALPAVTAFALWQIFFEGNGLWFDLFMGVSALITFYFIKRKRFTLAGAFWALAFISKQTAFWFLVPILLSISGGNWAKSKQGLIKFVLGSLLTLTPFLLILWGFGLLPDFYKWAINFGIFVLPKAQGQVQLPDLKNLAISLFPFTVFLPLFLIKKKESLNLFSWSIAGMMGAYPRFEYFHFQPAIPFLAMASAFVFISNWHKKELIKAFIPVYVLGSLYLFGGFFMRNYNEGTRFYESDVSEMSNYVRSNTNEGDKILVLNYWDNIYAFSDTLPAIDPWVPQLSWYMNVPGIQEDMIKGLESSKPKLILENPYLLTGLGSSKPTKVYDYVVQNYKLKEKVGSMNVLIPR
jgi:hypothetical protein